MTRGEIEWTPLKLGADVVQMLLPHRRPFLFVDSVLAVARSPRPSLRAQKLVSASEPVFEGHFPGIALWPGVYTIEGLGQCTNLLNILVAFHDVFAKRGGTDEDLYAALRAIDARSRLGGRPPTETESKLLDALGSPRSRIGYAGAVDVKLIEPVFAGATIDYTVTLTHVLANATRFDIEARVEDRPVARGTLTSATP